MHIFQKQKMNYQRPFFERFLDTHMGYCNMEKILKLFEPNANKLLNEIKRKKLIKDFNFDNSFDWFSMLERCAKSKSIMVCEMVCLNIS